LLENKKIMFIGAHYDDLEIGCGGTILKYKNISEISYLIVTDSIIKKKKKTIRNKKDIKKNIVEIKKKLNPKNFINLNFKCNSLIFNEKLILKLLFYIDKIKPDIIFTHWPYDIHQDHSAVGNATLSAARHIKNIFFYRSNFYVSNHTFQKNLFIDISKNFNDKIKLIKIFQKELYRHDFKWLELIKSLNSLDGKTIEKEYCETFEINRLFIN